MSQDNIALVRRYFDAVTRGDIETLTKVLSDTVVWHQPGGSDLSGTLNGRDAVFGLIGKFMERSAGTFKIDDVGTPMANGAYVAIPLHFLAEAAGKTTLSMSGIDVLRIEAGKIQEVWLFSGDQAAEDAFWS